MGITLDMINQQKQNRYWPEIRRNRRQALRRIYLDSVRHHVVTSGEPRVSPEVLREIKRRIRMQIRQERRRSAIIYSVSAAIALIVVTSSIFLLNEIFLRI